MVLYFPRRDYTAATKGRSRAEKRARSSCERRGSFFTASATAAAVLKVLQISFLYVIFSFLFLRAGLQEPQQCRAVGEDELARGAH